MMLNLMPVLLMVYVCIWVNVLFISTMILKVPENNWNVLQNWLSKLAAVFLLITEGVFGMSGAQGKLKEIVDLKKEFNFRLLIDDAHGFGTMGKTGAGTHEAQDCIEGVDIYFGTFAKSMAGIGAFVASTEADY